MDYSIETYVLKVRPALDMFLRTPNKENVRTLKDELSQLNYTRLKLTHGGLLAPLALMLQKPKELNQDVQSGIVDCIRLVVTHMYIVDLNELRTLLVIMLSQVRDSNSVNTRPNLSEELKLAVVQAMYEILHRASGDALELFYTQESATLLGQILLTLVEFIEKEKYKKLIISSVDALMAVFYVHDDADFSDVVLRNSVADTVFIFLPKVITVLFKTCLSDEKLGETLKTTAIKAMGRILCIIFEDSCKTPIKCNYDKSEFKALVSDSLNRMNATQSADEVFSSRQKTTAQVKERLKIIQENGRSEEWINATSNKLRVIYMETAVLRSHNSDSIRAEYAKMCCYLINQCGRYLRSNFNYVLESVVALSEDKNGVISQLCRQTLHQIQDQQMNVGLFDENSDELFDEHITKFPGIVNRNNESEQFTELMFFKGFLRNISATKLHLLLSVPKNLEMFCQCLLLALDLSLSSDLLMEEYSLREFQDTDFEKATKLGWRQYKNLSTQRCRQAVKEICEILGSTKLVNNLVFNLLLELFGQDSVKMNEILLVMLWMSTPLERVERTNRFELIDTLLREILDDKHWYLVLQPDVTYRLKVDKHTDWFVDRTPGLYESAVEIRKQDINSDDEEDSEEGKLVRNRDRVTAIDAKFNVLHTCLTLDVLGHCALFYGEAFGQYIFRCLHKVLLKVASSTTMIYQAAIFCLVSMQKALSFPKITHLIEKHTDYICFHLNTILKRSPESSAAVDILTVVLQLSTSNTIPHLERIFQTIRDECSKSYQTENINAFLRVFKAFLTYVTNWQQKSDAMVTNLPLHEDMVPDDDVLNNWIEILQKETILDQRDLPSEPLEEEKVDSINNPENPDATEENCDVKPSLPRHIELVKEILNEALKFVSSADKMHQILSLECLICGIPLLKDYEDELLPLIHLIWPSLVEKFRQKDAVVLNRCFIMFRVLATNSKEFILKRSLDDVIPFLKEFLQKAAYHSKAEKIVTQTQEYKLQAILLRDFANVIRNIQIDGKHLNGVAEVISLYLSQEQPKEFQDYAVQFYKNLKQYDGPLAYMVVIKKSHLKLYKTNVEIILKHFDIK